VTSPKTVQPRGDDGGDEELGSVGVGSSVGHGEQEGLVVPELEVLVGELVSVDGLEDQYREMSWTEIN
jgi:hypothetical protein